ncbi:MAG: site-specific integrase, partial [Solirubrobacteraceae bacterium]
MSGVVARLAVVTSGRAGSARIVGPVRPFLVVLPRSRGYWTVVDGDYRPVGAADGYLRELFFAKGRSLRTARMYAGNLAVFLTWASTRWSLSEAPLHMGDFVLMLRTTPIAAGRSRGRPRSADRINQILATVRGFYKSAVAHRRVDGDVLQALFEVGDDRWLPAELKLEGSGLRYRAAPRHVLPASRGAGVRGASEQEWEALLATCGCWRDRFLVVLLWLTGIRIGEA